MNNADLPAIPILNEYGSPRFAGELPLDASVCSGLTKREMFAMHAMQGLLSNSGGVVQSNSMSGTGFCNSDEKSLAQWSIDCADALLEELSK